MARALKRHGKFAVVSRGSAGNALRDNLPLLSNVALEQFYIFVINVLNAKFGKLTYLFGLNHIVVFSLVIHN